ncbi:MAG: GNAT family N-acetyltransferase [Acidimicrobiia bacterium]|nr:GNAT family N-acetyltransferase [Acidimicrobiia bacterium]
MQAQSVSSAAEFLERAGPLLNADEARHNLILGLAWTLHDRPEVYPEFRLWVVEEEGGPAAAALMTPPHNLVLADAADPGALPLLAAAVRGSGVPVPGVLGNRPTVDDFNRAWAALGGVTPILRMAEGVFALERVRPVVPAPGRPRPALPGERNLILDWLAAFFAEAMPWEPSPPEMAARMVDYRLESQTGDDGLWLWEDRGEAVSLVGFGGRTPGGQRIGPVYTPPGRRRRGYGTALVAAVSTWLLGHGRCRCFLYTDLANPTSNAMYRRIGYEQVAEAAQFAFEAGA